MLIFTQGWAWGVAWKENNSGWDKYRSDDLNYISNANSRNNKRNYNKVNDFIGQHARSGALKIKLFWALIKKVTLNITRIKWTAVKSEYQGNSKNEIIILKTKLNSHSFVLNIKCTMYNENKLNILQCHMNFDV